MKQGNYWGRDEEDLVQEYVVNLDSRLYANLRPKLLVMIAGVLNRYAIGLLKQGYAEDFIADCEMRLIEKVFPKYSIEQGKAYSFLGTAIKHYFVDLTRRSKPVVEIPIDYDQDVADNDRYDNYDELRSEAMTKFKRLAERSKGRKRKVLTSLVKLLESDLEFGRYFSTYYLVSQHKDIKPLSVYRILLEHGLEQFIVVKWSLERFKEIIGDEADENKIRIILNEWERN